MSPSGGNSLPEAAKGIPERRFAAIAINFWNATAVMQKI
jgi:hypothetical protein